LEVLRSLPETDDRTRLELALQIMLGAALGATQGYQAVEHVYARACELARKVGSAPELFPALWGFWYSHLAQGDMHRARVLAVEFLAQSEQQDDPLIRAIGHRMLANTADRLALVDPYQYGPRHRVFTCAQTSELCRA